MWRVEQALQRITGAIPAFMRPPYGEYNDNVKNVAVPVARACATPAQSKKLYDAVIKKKPSTILTLNHDIFKGTAYEFVPYAIEKLQKAGYKLVTLAECLDNKPAYQSVGKPSVGDDSWKC